MINRSLIFLHHPHIPQHGPVICLVGDVFIQGGSPGHAVLVVDVAEDPRTGRGVFLLVQSYMPAQEIHILKNPTDLNLSPWHETGFGETLRTPEWLFRRSDLKRF